MRDTEEMLDDERGMRKMRRAQEKDGERMKRCREKRSEEVQKHEGSRSSEGRVSRRHKEKKMRRDTSRR